MSQTVYQVDAFATGPFTGNPAGVCILENPVEAAWMQRVADEMNCAETAFVWPEADGALRLRWFTPTAEVDLCGHATLSAAHILFTEGHAPPQQATLAFSTRSGVLTATRHARGITLDFPATPPARVEPMPGLFEALGIAPTAATFVGRSRFDAFVVLPGEGAVRAVQPDFAALCKVPTRAVILTAAVRAGSSTEADFVSRFFAPNVGVPEDHVTGSAHCALAPYWCKRLERASLRGLQASRRSGVVEVRCVGDRVELSGRCVTMLRGQLMA